MPLSRIEMAKEDRLASMFKHDPHALLPDQRGLAAAQHACRIGEGDDGKSKPYACDNLRSSASQACQRCFMKKES